MPESVTTMTRPTPPAGDWRSRLRSSRFGTAAVLAVTLALVLGGAWLVNRPQTGPDGSPASGMEKVSAVELKGAQKGPAPEVGKPAQDFTATTYQGETVSLSGLRGRPVWLSFGASWCASCRAEFPDIQAAHAAAKPDGLAVVGVYLSEDATAVKSYADRLGLSYLQIPDADTRVASLYRVMGVPAHVFIDGEGVIRAIDMGVLSQAQIKDRLNRIGA